MGCGGDQVEFRLLGFPTKASGINIERGEGEWLTATTNLPYTPTIWVMMSKGSDEKQSEVRRTAPFSQHSRRPPNLRPNQDLVAVRLKSPIAASWDMTSTSRDPISALRRWRMSVC